MLALLQRGDLRMLAELGYEELRLASATMQRATAILKEVRETEVPAGQKQIKTTKQYKIPEHLQMRRYFRFVDINIQTKSRRCRGKEEESDTACCIRNP